MELICQTHLMLVQVLSLSLPRVDLGVRSCSVEPLKLKRDIIAHWLGQRLLEIPFPRNSDFVKILKDTSIKWDCVCGLCLELPSLPSSMPPAAFYKEQQSRKLKVQYKIDKDLAEMCADSSLSNAQQSLFQLLPRKLLIPELRWRNLTKLVSNMWRQKKRQVFPLHRVNYSYQVIPQYKVYYGISTGACLLLQVHALWACKVLLRALNLCVLCMLLILA